MLPCFGRETSYPAKPKSFITTAPVPLTGDSWVHTFGDHISAPSSKTELSDLWLRSRRLKTLYRALNPRYQDTFKKNYAPEALHCALEDRAQRSDLPAGHASHFLEFYAVTKSRHEAYRQHRPSAEAQLRAFELVLSSSWDI